MYPFTLFGYEQPCCAKPMTTKKRKQNYLFCHGQ